MLRPGYSLQYLPFLVSGVFMHKWSRGGAELRLSAGPGLLSAHGVRVSRWLGGVGAWGLGAGLVESVPLQPVVVIDLFTHGAEILPELAFINGNRVTLILNQ